MTSAESWAELEKLPKFFDAIGRGGEAIAFTAYGGTGGNWHFRKNADGSAQQVRITAETLAELASHGERARREAGHQLSFYPGRGGSRREQLTTIPCLKAESDQTDLKDQERVYREFEHIYGVTFTLVDTGNKSVHAYLCVTGGIEVRAYKATCSAFLEKLRDVGEYLGIDFIPDMAVAGPAQAMRLPGAIHKKTGEVARVLQYGKPCCLEDIELSQEAVKESRKKNTSIRKIEYLCVEEKCLGYEGGEDLKILHSLAMAWPKRIPGAVTYNIVVPLVGGLTNLLEPEQAADLLLSAGHNDQEGQPSMEGLLRWCQSFQPRGESKAAIMARLMYRAENKYGWQRPEVAPASLILKTTEETTSEEQIGESVKNVGGILVHRTGAGKTVKTLEHIRDFVDQAQIEAAAEGRESLISAVVMSPRSILNDQNARRVLGVNVSSSSPPGISFALKNIYCCCAVSLGRSSKLHGNPKLWGEFLSYGDVPGGQEPIPSGAGMPAAAFVVIDEFRQFWEMLFLTDCIEGKNSLWKDPAHHLMIIQNVIITIENAINVYCLDAQMGTIDQALLKAIRPGRQDALRVIGQKPKKHGGVYASTSNMRTWKASLLSEVYNTDRTKPILCIVATKGDPDGQSTHGMSAWDLKRLINSLEAHGFERPTKVAVIDGSNKDTVESQAILYDEKKGCDVVIATSVIQSGFSWVGDFHEVGFLAGGETLPPNIVGGQAGRRERTLKRCVAYLPKTIRSKAFPFEGYSQKEIELELMAIHAALGFKQTRHTDIFIRFQAAYIYRYVTELLIYEEMAMAYASADGWELEQLPDKPKEETQQKRKKATSLYQKVLDWDELTLGQQQLLMVLYGTMSPEDLADHKLKWIEGGAGLDLLKENLVDVAEILYRSRLVELCDGVKRLREDSLITHCGMVLSEAGSTKLLNQCGPLNIRLGRSESDPSGLKTIGTVVTALGGIKKIAYGKKGAKVAWWLPVLKKG